LICRSFCFLFDLDLDFDLENCSCFGDVLLAGVLVTGMALAQSFVDLSHNLVACKVYYPNKVKDHLRTPLIDSINAKVE
jgi:hypothetical protein